MNLLILVVDDEPDVEVLFRQQFRRDLRSGRFTMEFAQSAPAALQRITAAGDIIVKQHGGSIEVDTRPGEFTEFRLVLPRRAAASGER